MDHPLDKAQKYNTRRKTLSDPRRKLLNSTKTSAKTRGLEHSISINDIVIPSVCPVFGVPLILGGKSHNSVSVDRVDSSKGYIKGNVRVISFRANTLKSNGTLEEFQKIVEYLENEEIR